MKNFAAVDAFGSTVLSAMGYKVFSKRIQNYKEFCSKVNKLQYLLKLNDNKPSQNVPLVLLNTRNQALQAWF